VTSELNYELLDNFPNPFNPVTNINFSIKEAGLVGIMVFDLTGQQVAELLNKERKLEVTQSSSMVLICHLDFISILSMQKTFHRHTRCC